MEPTTPTTRTRPNRTGRRLAWRSIVALVLALMVSATALPVTASAEEPPPGSGDPGTEVTAVTVWGVPGIQGEDDPTIWTVELPYSGDAVTITNANLTLADPGAVVTHYFNAFTFEGESYPARDTSLVGDGRAFSYFKVAKDGQETLYKVEGVVPEAAFTAAQDLITQINETIDDHGTFQVRQDVARGSAVATWLGTELTSLLPDAVTSVAVIGVPANINATAGTAANPAGTPSAVAQASATFRYIPAGFGDLGEISLHFRSGSIPVQVTPVAYTAEPQGTVTAKLAEGHDDRGTVSVQFVGNEWKTQTGSQNPNFPDLDPLLVLYSSNPQQQWNGAYYSRYRIVATGEPEEGHYFDRYQVEVVAGENRRTIVDGQPPTQIADQNHQTGRGQTCIGSVCRVIIGSTVEFWVSGGLGLELTAHFTPDSKPVLDNWSERPVSFDLIPRQPLPQISTSQLFRAFKGNLQPGRAWLNDVELPSSAWSAANLNGVPAFAEPGQHTVRVQAFDGTDYSEPLDIAVNVAESTTRTEHKFLVRSNLPLTGEGGVGAAMRYTSGTATAAGAMPLDDLDGWPIDTSYNNGIFIDNYTDEVKPKYPLNAVLIGTRSVVPTASNQQVPITGARLVANGNQANAVVREFQGRLNITFPALTPIEDIEVFLVFDTGEDPAHTVTASSADASQGTVGAPLFLQNVEGSAEWLLAATPAEGFFVDHWQYRAADSGGDWTRDSDRDGQTTFTARVSEDREYQVVFREPGVGVTLEGTSIGVAPAPDTWGGVHSPEAFAGELYGLTGATPRSYLALGTTDLTWVQNGITVVRPSEQVDAFDNATLWFPIGFEQAVTGTITVEVFAGDAATGDPIGSVSWDDISPSAGQTTGRVAVPVPSLPLIEEVTVRLTAGENPPAERTYPLAIAPKDNGHNEARAAAITDVLDAFAESRATNTNYHGSPYVMTTVELKSAVTAIAAADSAEAVAAAHEQWVKVLVDTGNHVYHSGNRVMVGGGTVVTLPVGANAGMYAVASLEQRYPDNWTFHASSQYGAAAFGHLTYGGANDEGKITNTGSFGGTYATFYRSCMEASTGSDQFGAGNACPYTNGIGIQTFPDGGYTSFGGSPSPITWAFTNADPAIWNNVWYSWPGRMGWVLGELREAFSDAELSAHEAYTFALANQHPLGEEYTAAFKELRLEFLDFLFRTSSAEFRDVVREIDALDVEAEGAAAAVAAARASYDALGSGERAEVFNYDDLTAAELALLGPIQAAAYEIDLLIEAIGVVDYTDESRAAIAAATAAWEDASAEVRALVARTGDLVDAQNAFDVLAATAVALAEGLIEGVPELDDLAYPDDAGDVEAAQAAYDALLGTERDAFKAELVAALDAAVAKIAALRQVYLVAELAVIYATTGEYLHTTITNPAVGSSGGEWAVLGLARSGVDIPAWYDTYVTNVETTVEAGNGSLGAVTDHARVIIALSALGVDPTDVAGHNLLVPLANYAQAGASLNGAVFSLIALDTRDYEIPTPDGVENLTTREKLVERILAGELPDGGWTFFGADPDPDMTAMALQALANYTDDPDVAAAVDRGLGVLSALQQDDGGYESWGNATAESSAQVIVALTALGIDPLTDERFVKPDGNPLSALAGFYVDGGGFWFNTPGPANAISSEQGYYALTAYFRFTADKTSLYDMSDLAVDDVAPVVEITSAPSGTVDTREATIEFTVDDDTATVEYRLDEGEWVEVEGSPIELTDLADGEHTIEIRATDPAGNEGSDSATWTVEVEVTDPRSVDEAWVLAAFEDFLGRAPSGDELVLTLARLSSGTSRVVVAGELSSSEEWIRVSVRRFFLDTLDREPDAGGLAFWVNQVRSGRRTLESVGAQFYASSEYYRKAGGTDVAWVTDLYVKVLGRQPDPGGLSYWTGQTASRGRDHVASWVYGSPESRRTRVRALYDVLLGRQPDPSGLVFWSNRVAATGDLALAVHLVTSNEYANRAHVRFP